MMQTKHIVIQGLSIRYYQSKALDKDGTLLFLHGWGSEAAHFKSVLDSCGNSIALDLPGFGGSETPKSSWDLEEYVSFLHEFVGKMGLKDFILAGHSFGGSLAIQYCVTHDGVKKLILIGSAGIRKKDTFKKVLWLVLAKAFGWILRLPGLRSVRGFVRSQLYNSIGSDYIDAGAMTETYKKIISRDLQADMKKLSLPTVLIWGENDDATPVQDGRLMRSLIKDAELFVVPNAGHYVFWDNEPKFLEIFLKQLA